MKINFRETRDIITKSNIPGVDFVINPYVGCQHGCIYCYAEFMIRFTGHKGDKWGKFLDVKIFDLKKVKPQRYDNKRILLSSVTDPYIPSELKQKFQS
jgi:DNA repair photolyase